RRRPFDGDLAAEHLDEGAVVCPDLAEAAGAEGVLAGQEDDGTVARPNADVAADLETFEPHLRPGTVDQNGVGAADDDLDAPRRRGVADDVELRAVEHRPADDAAAGIDAVGKLDRH